MRQLFIDSRDRIAGSPQDFKIQLRDTLTTTAANYFRIDNMRIPLVMPRVKTGLNDKLYINFGGPSVLQVFAITLTQGTFAGGELATMIQTALHDAHPESPNPEVIQIWQVKYDYHTASMSIANLTDTSFYIFNDAELKAMGVKLNATYPNSFCSQLFYDNSGNVTTSPTVAPGTLGGGVSWNFPYVSMIANDLVYVASRQLSTKDCFGPSGAADTLACLVTSTDFASVLNQSMPAEVWLPCPVMTTQTLDFQVRSRSYDLLTSLPNWSMTISIR